ncbi:MAG: arylsulfatase [Verrucomicrobiales bacterium]|nr:arylsulfatase [Verrucomicrobiales bacterium]
MIFRSSLLFILSLLFAVIELGLCSDPKPNVVIFLADDQGWGDLSVHGNTNLATPHLDSLAEEGTLLENFYVCAVCAPTRAEFLTGRYHFRTGVSGVSEGSGRLNPDETTVADLLKAAGYATGIFGKWHNGTQSPYHPLDRGFDEFYGFTSGHWGHYFSPPLDHNRTRVKGQGYITDDITNHAIRFIEKHQENPFFCYVPLPTPHSPFYVDDDFYEKFDGMQPEMKYRDPEKEDLAATRAALAMCENIDWNVGRVLETLDRLDLKNDTLVIYFSDNGPNSYRWNGGMKGKKASVEEGGLRSPFLIRWPGKIPARRSVPEVVGAIDLFSTLADLAGIPNRTAKPINGRSFAPLLLGDSDANWPDRHLFSVWRKKATVRTHQYRLDNDGALFDITKDRGQQNDLADEKPEIAKTLRAALQEHREEAAQSFSRFADRPFTVGYADSTTLPARDGVPHGTIRRSSKAPNNSFFTHWTSEEDRITWDIEVGEPGDYRVILYYTCAEENVGTRVRLARGASSTETVVAEAFDPPIWDKSKERVEESHYFVKDFRALEMGTLRLEKGRAPLILSAPEIVSGRAIDVYSLVLEKE